MQLPQRRWASVFLLLLVLCPGRLSAEDMAVPKGAVILTLAGDITHANRGAFDPKRDGFLKHHEITFGKAVAFDRTMLSALKQGEIRSQPPQFSGPTTFKGPLLTSLLAAAGARVGSVKLMALDGFATELSPADIVAKDWILAMSADGVPLALGGLGPLWLMHTPSRGTVVSHVEEQRWPWALFYIEVSAKGGGQ